MSVLLDVCKALKIDGKEYNLMSLTEKQKRFVDEYLIDLNATRAYKKAYPNCKKDETASSNGSRLLANEKVAAYVEQRMKKREKRTEITQDRVIKELANIGFLDVRKLFDKNGIPIKITELDDETAASIIGVKTKELYDKQGEFIGFEKEYKLADKKGALELLGKHLGMFKSKVEVSGDIEINNPYKNLTTEELKKLIQNE